MRLILRTSLVNQNVTASEEMYSDRETYTTLLLGTRYVMLRREFEIWRERDRGFPTTARRLLVALGGTDPEALTLRLTKAVARINTQDIQIAVVVGGSNPDIAELQHETNQMGPRVRDLLTDVHNMASVMAK